MIWETSFPVKNGDGCDNPLLSLNEEYFQWLSGVIHHELFDSGRKMRVDKDRIIPNWLHAFVHAPSRDAKNTSTGRLRHTEEDAAIHYTLMALHVIQRSGGDGVCPATLSKERGVLLTILCDREREQGDCAGNKAPCVLSGSSRGVLRDYFHMNRF
eukprot:Nk52_evm1s896 gene=Nk52_evmTU1s896